MNLFFVRVRLLLPVLALAAQCGFSDPVPLDENLVVLFADLHITTNPAVAHQREGLSRCIRDVLAMNPRPAHALFYGDLSFNSGATSDYAQVKELVKPLEAAGIRWDACPGNHDRRDVFFSVFPERKADPPSVADRWVSVVKTPHADFILLDSCLEGRVNGGLDDAQRAWLKDTLARADKPLFVGAHHPLKETGIGGLLASNTFCSGYIYGHNHGWLQRREEGVETVCLPSTGHWGDIGFVTVKLEAQDAVFTLSQRDYYAPRPAAKPEDIKPEWKARVLKNNGSQCRIPLKR